jgi:UDP-glucuronate 4-epimerase
MSDVEASPPVLVTGAAGFIGSHVVEALAARGVRTVGVDNFDPFYARETKERTLRDLGPTPGFTFVEADLTRAEALRAVMSEHKPAGVIHLAAKAGVRPSLADPAGYMHANVTGTAVVLDEARRAGCARVLVASSSSVYGDTSPTPFREDPPLREPISPYAASKLACEHLGYTHWKLTGMPTAMLRFFTVFGPRQRPDLAIAKFLPAVAEGRTITLFGPDTSRDYTYVDDIVAGVLAAYDRIDRHGYRVWNLGGSRPVTLSDMVATISRVVGRPARTEVGPVQPGDVRTTWADLTRSRQELGYSPAVPFEEGVARQWAWARSQ